MPKDALFFGKSCKNCRSFTSKPQLARDPLQTPYLLLFYTFTKFFISPRFFVVVHKEQNAPIFFTSNSEVFVDGAAKYIISPGAQGALATPLL